MTTRRDVLLGIAGVAATAAVPVEAVAKAASAIGITVPSSYNEITFNGSNWTMNVGDLVWDGQRMFQIVSKTTRGGSLARECHGGDLKAGVEYTVHCPHLSETV